MLRHFDQRRVRTAFEQADAHRHASIGEHQHEHAFFAIVEVRSELGEAQIVRVALRHMRRKIDPITLRCHDLSVVRLNYTSGSF